MTVEANFSISVQTDADEGTAEIGDFEMFEKEIIVSPGQTCFEIKIILDAILENRETFIVSIESTDSAFNVIVPQAQVIILDSTSKFSVVLSMPIQPCWSNSRNTITKSHTKRPFVCNKILWEQIWI